ncbi:LysM peptidoglycan-binding domain-containing protein, partial [Litorivicinus sp.]|nr:LysM peptidoglycan-binding domain-containing protein [Litorivicinus sp.]
MPSQASALDLGQSKPLSRLGEPLELLVPLENLGSVAPLNLFPLLANVEAFSSFKLTQDADLSRLTFSISDVQGKPHLIIRSAAPWMKQNFAIVVEIITPNDQQNFLVAATIQPKLTVKKPIKPELKEPPRTSITPALIIAEPRPSESPTERVITVKSGDTMWRIAERLKTSDSTVEQVIVALYETNPRAFEIGNINALKKGATLALSENYLTELANSSTLDALTIFKAHMKEPKRDFRLQGNIENSPSDIANPVSVTELQIDRSVVTIKDSPAPAPAPASVPAPVPAPT